MTILAVRGLVKHFGGVPAIDGLDLDVDEGGLVAVIGPNGAGKSTLLDVISGTQPPTSSAGIVFDGRELVGLPPHRIRQLGIARVLQSPRSFAGMAVVDSVMLGAMFGSGRQRLTEAVARRRACEALDRLGLRSLADVEVERLNLHDKRLLELARALAGHPRLLLLDEVMAGLTPVELDSFVATIRRVRVDLDLTIVWVEHVMKAVTALAHHVVVLHAGRKLAEGPPEAVVRHPAVIEAYLGRHGSHDARR